MAIKFDESINKILKISNRKENELSKEEILAIDTALMTDHIRLQNYDFSLKSQLGFGLIRLINLQSDLLLIDAELLNQNVEQLVIQLDDENVITENEGLIDNRDNVVIQLGEENVIIEIQGLIDNRDNVVIQLGEENVIIEIQGLIVNRDNVMIQLDDENVTTEDNGAGHEKKPVSDQNTVDANAVQLEEESQESQDGSGSELSQGPNNI